MVTVRVISGETARGTPDRCALAVASIIPSYRIHWSLSRRQWSGSANMALALVLSSKQRERERECVCVCAVCILHTYIYMHIRIILHICVHRNTPAMIHVSRCNSLARSLARALSLPPSLSRTRSGFPGNVPGSTFSVRRNGCANIWALEVAPATTGLASERDIAGDGGRWAIDGRS